MLLHRQGVHPRRFPDSDGVARHGRPVARASVAVGVAVVRDPTHRVFDPIIVRGVGGASNVVAVDRIAHDVSSSVRFVVSASPALSYDFAGLADLVSVHECGYSTSALGGYEVFVVSIASLSLAMMERRCFAMTAGIQYTLG